uniref:Putative secreted protein n=1 Tax=Xenopsylla cheopis TaxID=163159 RepID=A0A6M2DVY8_XENCH
MTLNVVVLILTILVSGMGLENPNFTITRLDSPGILYEGLAEVEICSDYLDLIVTYDLTQYQVNFKKIFTTYDIINSRCNGSLYVHVCKSFVDSSENVMRSIIEQNKLINDLLHETKVNKNKRALISVIGNVCKQLFGTLDESDAAYYDEQISRLKSNENHLIKLNNMQISIYESEFKVLSNLTKTLNKITDEVETEFDKIFTMVNNSQRDLQVANIMIQIEKIFIIFNYHVENFLAYQNKLMQIIVSAIHGKLHPYIFSLNELKNQISKITPNLGKNIRFPSG